MMVQLFEIREILNHEQLPKIFIICVCAVSSHNEIVHVFSISVLLCSQQTDAAVAAVLASATVLLP